MEETVLVEDFCRRLRIVVISEHHIRSLHADLSFAVLIWIIDLHAARKDRGSDAARLAVFVTVGRDERRAFRDSIAVEYGDSKRVECVYDIFVKLCSSADHKLKLASECAEDACEKLLSQVDADLSESVADLHHHLQQALLAGLAGCSPDLSVHDLKECRHKDQMRRLLLPDLIADMLESAGNIHLAAL